MDSLVTYKQLQWDLQAFKDNTQRITMWLADATADLGSKQNLPESQYDDLYALTLSTNDLALDIVDKLTEVVGLEEEDSFGNRLARSWVSDERSIEAEFKAVFEHFQLLYRQVMEQQRVEIESLRSSRALSYRAQSETGSLSALIISPEVPSTPRVPRYPSEGTGLNEDTITLLNKNQVQMTKAESRGSTQRMMELTLEKQRDLKSIEDKSLQLYQIHQKLASLTEKHTETIDTIEANMGETEVLTEQANVQLVEANVKKRQSMRKQCICRIILFAAIVTLVAVIALSVYFKFL